MGEAGSAIRTRRLTRRGFLVSSGAMSCGVVFAMAGGEALAKAGAGQAALAPNVWVTLHRDGAIDVICPGIELGQGAHSTLPRFLAEELDADWSHVRVVAAPSDEKTYGNPLFWDMQLTAGSRTSLGYFDVLRIAGAQARLVLLQTAARKWGVGVEELATADSVVSHPASGRRAAYGELVPLAQAPAQFPEFVDPDYLAQQTDDFFGDPPPSPVAPDPKKPDRVKLKSRRLYKLIGVDGPRRDIPAKVDGTARYGLDVQLPGMAYAMVETGPVQGGVPAAVDDAAARAVPGVIDVVRLPNGVAVAGENIFAVRAARALLKIEWAPGARTRGYDSAATLEDFSRIAADPAGHAGVRVSEIGDPASAEALLADAGSADHRIVVFETSSELVYHAPLEPQNATLRIADDGKSAEAWQGTQWPKLDQQFVGKALGIEPEAVKINTLYPGGSFGRRQEPGAVVDAAYVAKAIGRPVKVIWTREDDIKRNPFRQALVCRVEAAVAPDGTIKATRHRVVADSWFARMFPDWFEQYHQSDPGNWVGALQAYDVPLQLVDNVTERRAVDVCYMRGVGVTQAKFAQESLIDLIAAQHGKDPLDYRLQMLQATPRAVKVLQTVAGMSDWRRPRDGRALGLAYTPYSNAHAALVAEVSVDRRTGEVRVHEVWCAADVGLAIQPAIAASQIEGGILQGLSMALYERATLKDGVVEQTNFHQYPILRMSRTPDVNVRIISTDNAIAGAGEIGVMQIAPAVNNALVKLIGAPLTAMPMRPEAVLAAIRA
ncbi:MAG: molybdopterin cofactor-binding domain-containing protein [Caulobacteraceae bacterium]